MKVFLLGSPEGILGWFHVAFQVVFRVFLENREILPPKMDGENKGKPYEQMDDFGGTMGYPYFWKHPYINIVMVCWGSFCTS